MLATVTLLPGLVGALTVLTYLVPVVQFMPHQGLQAAISGVVAGALAWLGLGIAFQWAADPSKVSSGIYREIHTRFLLIGARLAAIELAGVAASGQSAYRQAVAMRDELRPMLDPSERSSARVGGHWLSGAGYIAAWQRVHRAEEALLALEPDAELVGAALYDRGRLSGSKMPGRDDLLKQSSASLVTLNGCLGQLVGLTGAAATGCREASRAVLLNIRKSINEYRDDLWEKLVYLRRRTIQTLLFTALTGYVVLVLALIAGAPASAVIAGSAFYLSGALIGLFHAAYLEQRRRTAVEDYGLAAARLVLLPLVGGIAGIVGAVLTAFVGAAPIGMNLLQEATNPQTGSTVLGRALDLASYPTGLLAAAIFGLTPGLLLQRISALGDDLKLDIAKSEPGGSEKAEATAEV